MNTAAAIDEDALVSRARGGDGTAFEELVSDALPRLRAVIRRLVGNPADVDDVAQDALAAAFGAFDSFRGDARFSTWLCSIGTRKAIDFLRAAKRWRPEAQVIYADECLHDDALAAEVGSVLVDPAFAYDAREHIAFCFACVGRSLEPEQHAAVVLRDIFDFTNREAAAAAGISVSALRHHLATGRREMEERNERLCALVSKTGVCHQCKGLRDLTPEARRGVDVPRLADMAERLEIVRDADFGTGVATALHDLFFRRIDDVERRGAGDASATTGCGDDTASEG